MPDDKKIIEPINAGFDEVAKAMVTPAASLSIKSRALATVSGQRPATPQQGVLDLGIEVERVVGEARQLAAMYEPKGIEGPR